MVSMTQTQDSIDAGEAKGIAIGSRRLPQCSSASSLDSKTFATDQTLGNAALQHALEQTPQPLAHCAPATIHFILAGQMEIGIGDGTTRRFGPGDVVLADDLTGQGHTTRSLGVPRISATVPVGT
jgi:hypothetical protein